MKPILLKTLFLLIISMNCIAQTPKVTKVTTLTTPIPAGSGGMEVDKDGNILNAVTENELINFVQLLK